MRKGSKVILVRVNPNWSTVPLKLSTKHKIGCRPVKIGTEGTVIGTQQGTGLILVKFKGRSWPAVCNPEDITTKETQPA
jgi:membrane protein implicated in regulation of membrane protease activity